MDDRTTTIINELRKENQLLRCEIVRLNERVELLAKQNRQLQEQLEQAERAAMRQAAPFRRDEHNKIPPQQQKPPGQKAGHIGYCRKEPEHIDETIEMPLDNCPKCKGPVTDIERIEQVIEEIPPVRPYVTRLITYRGRCSACGIVWSNHPLQTSYGKGASKVQLGPRALALAACLNKFHGLTMRKTCKVLHDLCGLRITAGGLSQALCRVAWKVKGLYDKLLDDIRASPAVFADETSWYVGSPGWWLWVFTNADGTVYRVDDSRGSKVVEDVLGKDFKGMLVSDCLSSYDPPDYAKHKCIAHHLRAISSAMRLPGMQDNSYLLEWGTFFKAVMILYRLREVLSQQEFADKRKRMENWCDELLARAVDQGGDVAIRNRLSKQRRHLLGCLYEPAAEPTNNRAERALRPAVIARKLSCGNRTERGRDCWQILSSISVTCHQRMIDFVDYLSRQLPLTASAG